MKISVVIPVYNVATFLRECLDSLLAQTYKDWEAICVDDGSTDGSGEILHEYAAKDARFRVFQKTNEGAGAARNFALERMNGQWVCFLDADDIMSRHCLSFITEGINRSGNVDVVVYEARKFNDGELVQNLPFDMFCRIGTVRDVSAHFDKQDVFADFVGGCYSKQLLEGVRFKPYIMGEDLLFINDVLLRAQRYVRLNAVVYGYRQRLGSVCHRPMTFEKARDRIYAWRDILKGCESSQGRAGVSYVRHYCTQLMEFAVYSGNTLGKRLDKETQKKLWSIWKDSLRQIVQLKVISSFQRLRIRVYFLCPCRFWAKVLFAGPYALKLLRNAVKNNRKGGC